MSDIASHPDPEIERVVQNLLFNIVGTVNIGDPAKVYLIGDIFEEIAQQFGPAVAKGIYIRVTWH